MDNHAHLASRASDGSAAARLFVRRIEAGLRGLRLLGPYADVPERLLANALQRMLGLVALIALLWLAGCASLPAPAVPAPSQALDGRGSTLHAVVAASLPDAELSGVRLLADGDQALDARLALIARAERSLDLQTYVLASDATGARVLRALRDAAARGVRVRLLVDDLSATGNDELYAALAALPQLQVRLFNPLPARGDRISTRIVHSLHEVRRINRRMHNKLFIVDNQVAIAGGRNIADEYFMRSASGNFIDIDALVAGPAVAQLSAEFDRYWNSPHAWPAQSLAAAPADAAARFERLTAHATDAADPAAPASADRLRNGPLAQQLAAGRLELTPAALRVIADEPAKAAGQADLQRTTHAQVSRLMGTAQDDLLIVSPYFVPGEHGMAMLAGVRARQARLTVMTNSLGATDEPLVHTGYARYRPALLQIGASVHELAATLAPRSRLFGGGRSSAGSSTGRLHAKVAVVDRRQLVIGSLNMDGRSARHNTELALVIDSPALAAEVVELFGDDIRASSYRLRLADDGAAPRIEWLSHEAGREVLHAAEPDTGRVNALKLALLGAAIAEDML